jgi:hypothetical protein
VFVDLRQEVDTVVLEGCDVGMGKGGECITPHFRSRARVQGRFVERHDSLVVFFLWIFVLFCTKKTILAVVLYRSRIFLNRFVSQTLPYQFQAP